MIDEATSLQEAEASLETVVVLDSSRGYFQKFNVPVTPSPSIERGQTVKN